MPLGVSAVFKSNFLNFATAFTVMYAIPIAAITALSEKPTAHGRTEIAGAWVNGWHWSKDNKTRIPDLSDNYSVYEKSKTIVYTREGLLPGRILMRNGEITQVTMLFNKMLPVNFYRPATGEEAALWRKHFKT